LRRAAGSGEPQVGTAADLSVGGLFVRELTELPHGETVAIELDLETGPLAVAALSRWVRHVHVTADLPAGTGIEFVDLDAAALAALERELGRPR
jgi:hypothetical protein